MAQQNLSKKKFKESSKATLVKDATSNMHATTRPYLGSKLCKPLKKLSGAISFKEAKA